VKSLRGGQQVPQIFIRNDGFETADYGELLIKKRLNGLISSQ